MIDQIAEWMDENPLTSCVVVAAILLVVMTCLDVIGAL